MRAEQKKLIEEKVNFTVWSWKALRTASHELVSVDNFTELLFHVLSQYMASSMAVAETTMAFSLKLSIFSEHLFQLKSEMKL